MHYNLFRGNLVAFLLIWLGITGYTLWSLVDISLPYPLWFFGVFLAVLTATGVPLVWLWYKSWPKTIQHQTAVVATASVLIFYWGPFAPVHSILSLQLDSLQLRWIAFAYIWEVVLVGAMVIYAVLYTTRFADRFMKGNIAKSVPAEEVHARIASIPLRAWIAFTSMVIFGYVVGSFQLYYFSQLPFAETIKNLINGIAAGTISAFVVFFALEQILRPVLQKSGSALRLGAATNTHRPSLFVKVYAITGLLVLISVGFFGTMAYGQGQAILEQRLFVNMQEKLSVIRARWEGGNRTVSEEERTNAFGSQGVFLYLTPETTNRFVSSYVFSPTTRERIEEASNSVYKRGEKGIFLIDRARNVEIIGLLPLRDGSGYLAAMMSLSDFDQDLYTLTIYIFYVFILIAVIIAIIGTLFARSIVLPIREIQEGGVRIGSGDFDHPIMVYSNDELEDLSHALNEAARKLEASYSNLEAEVSLRTKEVAEANTILQKQISELDKTSKQLVQRDFELQQANERYREVDEAKSHFVSIAAHQLRTPLSAIKWALHMLLAGDIGKILPEQQPLIAQAFASTERLITLVGDLLNVARIESGQILYRFEPFSPEALVNNLINESGQKAKEKIISLSFVCKTKPFPNAAGDSEKLTMALQSIIENAISYTEPGGNVTVSLEKKDDKYYQISVADNGIGIPKSQQHLIFQKFFRGDNVIRKQIAGTGIALYITSKIIEAHGGKIEIQSEENTGTTFMVTLPFS